MDRWKGKVAVVTGASSGIGAAICRKLVEEGCVVVGLARRLELVQQLAESVKGKAGKIHALKTDVTVEEEIKAAFEWISSNVGPVHILVNNAGVMNCSNLVMGETSKWRQVLETNVLGLCIATREAIQIMKKNNVEGQIVNINSVAGHKSVYLPMTNLYSASKHALTNLTEMFRLEMITENIRVKVTSLSPGLVDTDILKHDHLADYLKSFPKLKSEDVVEALIYILSTPPSVQFTKMDRWRGKVAIVTGASAGIGAAICDRLVEEGCLVVGLARRVEMIQQQAEKLKGKRGKLYGVKVDMTIEDDILKAFKWTTENLGPVHILVNNAGVVTNATLISGETAQWKTVLDTNVLGLCIATREAIQSMRANKIEGHIVHINSITGHTPIYLQKTNVYGATKYAVTNLTEILRKELIDEKINIKISSVSPGLVDTILLGNIGKEEVQSYVEQAPKLKSEDVADAVAYIIGTPPHVQIHEITIKVVGEDY